MTRSLRIFISSPGDVIPERRRAALVIEKLAKDYARFFDIKPYLWESEPMLASGHFQDAIVPPGETDILILILWSRLGTPLPEHTTSQDYRGIDGRTPVTGTEWEFESALAAHKLNGTPDLLAYKKAASPKAEYRSDADLEELRNQLQKLEAFWRRHFVDRGEFRAAFGEFQDLDGFEAKVESDLRRLIERRVTALEEATDKSVSLTWQTGSPFRGLETYRFEHAPIFFGRSEATKTAVEHLVQNAETGRPFLLVLGASGTGKSSLAQAGIVPGLGVRGVVPGISAWRRAVIRPGGHPGGPFMALAAGIAGDDALPELLTGQDVAALGRHLETAAADPGFPIVSALTAREQVARQNGDLLSCEGVRLIVVVDQLEELFTLGEVTPDQRKAFILCLKGLIDSGRIFVVATMRSDYWHRAAEAPLLVALAEGRGRFDLLPPTQAELTEMIRRPAEAAGLSFEADPRTEIRLDATLAEEASREPGALPLLSFLLDGLYAKDVQESHGSTFNYASMRTLGGLKGAIAARAETTFTALPANAQAALPTVLRALVTINRSGAEPTARAVAMTRFPDGSAERRIVEALLDPQVRLLVADADEDGARVRLAHEALISHWERAKRQITQDRDDLRTRAMIEEAEAQWRPARQRDKRGYLLRDPVLANAVDLAKRWTDELGQESLDFIDVSRRRARIVQRATMSAAGLFALLTVGAVFLWIRADGQEKIAMANEARALGALSRSATDDGRRDWGLKLALAAWPRTDRDVRRPRLEIALEGMAHAIRANESFTPPMRHDYIPVKSSEYSIPPRLKATFSRDDTKILSRSVGDTVRQWNASTGREIGPAINHKGMNGALFTHKEDRILSWSEERAQLWDAATGQLASPSIRHNELQGVLLASDDKQLLTWSDDNKLLIWDIASGQEAAAPMPHDDRILGAVFVRSESLILSWSRDGTIRLWDRTTGKPSGPIMRHKEINGVAFTQGENHLLSWSDSTLRFWDLRSGLEIAPPMENDGEVTGALVLPDQKHALSWSNDGTLQIWNLAAGNRVGNVMKHESSVYGAKLCFHNKLIMSLSSDKTTRLWDAATGEPFGEPERHEFIPIADCFLDGPILSRTYEDGTLRLWDMHIKGDTILNVSDVEISHSQRRMLIVFRDGTMELRDLSKAFPVKTMLHDDYVSGSVVSPDETRILSWSGDKTMRLWDLNSGDQIGPAMVHDDAVSDAIFTHAGNRLLSRSSDGSLRRWDAKTGQLLGPVVELNQSRWAPLSLLRNGALMLWSNKDLRLWEIDADEPGPAMTHASEVNGATFTRSGGLYSWTNSQLYEWDAKSGRLINNWTTNSELVSVEPSPDQKTILAVEKTRMTLIDAGTGIQIGSTMSHDLDIRVAQFTKDGRRILSTSLDKTVRLWDAKSGKMLVPIMRHDQIAMGAAFTNDEGRILSWSYDGTVRLWDTEKGQSVGPTLQHDSRVEGAMFVDDDRRIVSWSVDGKLRLWDVATGQQVGPAMLHVGPVGGVTALPQVKRLLTHSKNALKQWNVDWPSGNLIEVACALLGKNALIENASVSGVKITDPICEPGTLGAKPDWTRTEPRRLDDGPH